LGGEEVPESWRGSIKNLTYKIGGEFETPGVSLKMHVTTHNQMRKTHNVIGYIKGAIEPGNIFVYNYSK